MRNSAPARLADDLAKRFPEDTAVQSDYVPMIHASITLGGKASKDSDKAIAALAPSAPYEMGKSSADG